MTVVLIEYEPVPDYRSGPVHRMTKAGRAAMVASRLARGVADVSGASVCAEHGAPEPCEECAEDAYWEPA